MTDFGAIPDSSPDDAVEPHARVHQEIDLDASLDDVWDAMTDPRQLGAWLGSDVQVEIRPECAGHVTGDDGTRYAVLVTDVDDRQRVAWHWWDDRGALSSVELTIEPRGDLTRLRITETLVDVVADLPGADRVQACARRWGRATSRLWQGVSAYACTA